MFRIMQVIYGVGGGATTQLAGVFLQVRVDFHDGLAISSLRCIGLEGDLWLVRARHQALKSCRQDNARPSCNIGATSIKPRTQISYQISA